MRAEQLTIFDDNPEYDNFVQKFVPKKTTDDCYTPPEIYEAIRDWACEKWKINPGMIVRPFYPGGDYENYDYPYGCTVLDNPPFSILSKICEFYLEREIPFFLFAPTLTCLSVKNTAMRMNHIICSCDIIYENGAIVKTSFVSSYGGDIVAQTAPDLTKIVNNTTDKIRRKKTRLLPKYEYPSNIVTTAMMQKYAKYGVEWEIHRGDCVHTAALDAQREQGKTIFGCGLLLSSRAAAERAAAERAAAERAAAERVYTWPLSQRELEIIKSLDSKYK